MSFYDDIKKCVCRKTFLHFFVWQNVFLEKIILFIVCRFEVNGKMCFVPTDIYEWNKENEQKSRGQSL